MTSNVIGLARCCLRYVVTPPVVVCGMPGQLEVVVCACPWWCSCVSALDMPWIKRIAAILPRVWLPACVHPCRPPSCADSLCAPRPSCLPAWYAVACVWRAAMPMPQGI